MSIKDIKSFDQYLLKPGSKVKLNVISADPWEQKLSKLDAVKELGYLQEKLIQL